MAEKPKVLLLAPWAPNLYSAGSRRIWTACKYLSDRYDFTLATFARTDESSRSIASAADCLWSQSLFLRSVFKRIHFVPAVSDPEPAEPGARWLPEEVRRYYYAAMRERLARILAEEDFDLVHVEYDLMAPYVEDLRALSFGKPVLLTHHDMGSISLFQSYFREMSGLKRFLRLGEWWRRILFTRAVFRAFDGVVVLTQADRARLSRLMPSERVHVVSTGVDLQPFGEPAPRSERAAETLVYVGHYPHYPNEDAVLWFAREILPLIWRRRPSVKFQIVGSYPTPAIVALAAGEPRIEVTDMVDDVRPYEAAAAVVVAPLRLGQGIKGKVLEAFAAGTPVVATSCANEGIRARAEEEILLADSPRAFAAQVLRLLEDEALWRRLSAGGHALVRREHSWARRAEELDGLYRRSLAASWPA